MIREDTTTIQPMVPTEVSPIEVSAAAAGKLAEVMAAKALGDAGLRVFVSGGGCSGLQYGMAFETQAEDDDVVFASSGVTLYVDPVSIGYLQGATIDYVDNLMGGGFKIENPNAVASCGCGHSFRTGESQATSEGAGGCCSH